METNISREVLKNEKILVVDDEASLRDIYVAFLEMAGYAVIAAENPVQAFDLAAREKLFLVVTDYRMPRLDGANFCELIKERTPSIPVIMISGFVAEAVETFASCQYGPDTILDKPVSQAALVAEVDKYATLRIAELKGSLISAG